MAKHPEKAIDELIKIHVGTDDDGQKKLYALRAPDNITDEFIVFQRTDNDRDRHINGPSGLSQALIQIDCYSKSYYGAKDLAALVEGTLDGYSGTVAYGTDSPQESIVINAISLQNDIDLLEQEVEPLLYRNSASYLVTYNQ